MHAGKTLAIGAPSWHVACVGRCRGAADRAQSGESSWLPADYSEDGGEHAPGRIDAPETRIYVTFPRFAAAVRTDRAPGKALAGLSAEARACWLYAEARRDTPGVLRHARSGWPRESGASTVLRPAGQTLAFAR